MDGQTDRWLCEAGRGCRGKYKHAPEFSHWGAPLLRPRQALYHMSAITTSVCAPRTHTDDFARLDSVVCEQGREVGAAAGPVSMRRAHREFQRGRLKLNQRLLAVEMS